MVKDGRLVDVDVTVWPTRDLDGTITGASAIVRDISDLKRAKRKLTQLYEQQRHVALTLQTALMGTPPRIPEIETAHRYLPATGGAGVGGDLFDLIPLGAGRARVFVGDVMGRGPEAAAVMGQVRSAARPPAGAAGPPGPDGVTVARIAAPISVPLGVGQIPHQQASFVAPAGSILALYTDGLVETRDRANDGQAAITRPVRVGSLPPLPLPTANALHAR